MEAAQKKTMGLDPILERQVLQGMRSVSLVFVIIYAVSIVLWAILWTLPASPKSHITRAGGNYDYGMGEAFLLVLGACEIGYFGLLRLSIRRDSPFPRSFTYAVAFLECLQPTFFLYTWGLVLPAGEALSQSPIFFYFLLIGAGALRMDAVLSAFSGFVAGAGYIALSWWLYARAGSPDPWKDVTSLHLSKGVYLMVCGGLMAFVASQIRRRLTASLDARELIEKMSREKEEREREVQESQTLAVIRERETLVQELHDTVTQKIAFVSISAQALQMRLASGSGEDLNAELARLAKTAAEAQVDIRDFIHDARSASVLARGFVATLTEYLETLESDYGMRVEIEGLSAEAIQRLDSRQQVIAFKIIQEALNNSRKHAGTMSARISIVPVGEGCRMAVEDEGRGFDTAAPPLLSHYGLDIMRSRARQIGAVMTIEAARGRGTRIALDFAPDRRAAGEPRKPAIERRVGEPLGGEGRSSPRILVIDDHELFREGLCGLLRLSGYTVQGSVGSAEEGLERLRSLRPDLIIMDIQMPGIDGIKATARIKTEYPEARIILLTGSASPLSLFEAIKVGASAFALKTSQAYELVNVIEGVLAGESAFGPEMALDLLSEFPETAAAENRDAAGSGIQLGQLSSRQRQVLGLVSQGLTYKEIGSRLNLAERTIKYHMGEIIGLLQVKNKAEAARLARLAGL